jgi:glucosylceramidase
MYWNLSLDKDGFSRWGWRQNSLVSVDLQKKTYTYNFEYYLLKHVSHYVVPGARLLETEGTFANLLAFINPDNRIIVIARNDEKTDKTVTIKVGNKMISPLLKTDSFNTFVIEQ